MLLLLSMAHSALSFFALHGRDIVELMLGTSGTRKSRP